MRHLICQQARWNVQVDRGTVDVEAYAAREKYSTIREVWKKIMAAK